MKNSQKNRKGYIIHGIMYFALCMIMLLGFNMDAKAATDDYGFLKALTEEEIAQLESGNVLQISGNSCITYSEGYGSGETRIFQTTLQLQYNQSAQTLSISSDTTDSVGIVCQLLSVNTDNLLKNVKHVKLTNIKALGYYAFAHMTALEDITITADSVVGLEEIGENAFNDCPGFKSFTCPSTLTKMHDFAFYKSGLVDITLNDNLTTIANKAFYYCGDGNNFYVNPGNNSNFKVIDNCLVNIETGSAIAFLRKSGENVDSKTYKITDSRIKTLDMFHKAFNDTNNVTLDLRNSSITDINNMKYIGVANLQLPERAINVNEYAFDGNKGVTNVELGGAKLSNRSFFGCTNLKRVVFGKNTQLIDASIFQACSSLEEVDFAGYSSEIPVNTFRLCRLLSSISNTDNITLIGAGAFDTSGLINAEFKKATKIQDYAFQCCKQLESISLPEATILGNYAFESCSNLKTINIDKIQELGRNCLARTSIETLNIENATSVGQYILSGVESLREIFTPDVEITLPDPQEPNPNIANSYFTMIYYDADTHDVYSSDKKNLTVSKKMHLKAILKQQTLTINNYSTGYKTTEEYEEYNADEDYDISNLYPGSRTGYTFGGYFSDEALTQEIAVIPQGYEGYTIYCKWIPDEYTITYELNGGINNKNNPLTYTAEDGTITLETPTREGYVFDGWYEYEDFSGRKIETINVYTKNITLYAKWTCAHLHTEVKDKSDATCVSTGYTGDTYCTDCKEKLETGSVIPVSSEHAWDNGSVTKEPTEDKTGVRLFTCTLCNKTKEEVLPVVIPCNHETTETRNAKAATCTKEGYTGDVYCTLCDALQKEGEIIPATGHTGGEADCTNKAVCEVCGESYGDLSPENHKHSELRNDIKALCETAGYTGDVCCTACNKILKEGSEIPATGHTTGKPVKENVTETTCTKDGSHDIVEYCTVCNKVITSTHITIPATGHKWDIGKVTKAPTEDETGIRLYTCEICGETQEETLPVVVVCHHETTETRNAREASCTINGYTGDTYCTLCGAFLTEGSVIEATGHTGGEVDCCQKAVCTRCGEEYGELNPENHKNIEIRNQKAAGCEEGYTGDKYCKNCNALIEMGGKLEGRGHSWDQGTTTKEPTYEEEGERVYTCTICQKERTEVLNKLVKDCSHDAIEVRNAETATCEKTGYTGDEYCEHCGILIKNGTETPATGHKWDNGVITKEPTKEETGIRIFTCNLCGSTKEEILPLVIPCSHEAVETKNIKEATCKEEGYTGDYYCKDCGKLIEQGNIIPMTEHQWDYGKITKKPTYEEDGERVYTCDICKEEKTEVLIKLDKNCTHENTEVRNVQDATCKKEGYTGDTYCLDCKNLLSIGEITDKAEHEWTSAEITKAPTYEEEGEKTSVCVICGEKKIIKIPVLKKQPTTEQKPTENKVENKTPVVNNETTQQNNNTVITPVTVSKITGLKVKNDKKKTATVSFKKAEGTKYQLQYSTDKKFKKSVKKKTLTKTSYKIKGLKKSKTYYVRVRAYKIVDGKEVYSNWVTKKVKIKK